MHAFRMPYLLMWVFLFGVTLSGCSATQNEWLGRQLSGLDCRPEKLDAAGRCVPAR
jgi:hypothetical protein